MPTVFQFLNEFRGLLREADIRFAITSGMACVRYGLQQTTKDSDWIIEPTHLGKLREMLESQETRMPPWRVRYRGIFGAPLEEEWMIGGWTSHLTIFNDPGSIGSNVDWFARPPRVTEWETDSEGYASRRVVAQMKKTNRAKDWPIVDGLGWQMRSIDPLHALLNLRSPETLQGQWSTAGEELRTQAVARRPLLRLLESNSGCPGLVPGLMREREAWIAINEARYRVYQREWKEFHRRWRQTSDWSWPTEEPFVEQHDRLVSAAREHRLNPRPLDERKKQEVYEAGLAEAAKRFDVDVETVRAVAPHIQDALP